MITIEKESGNIKVNARRRMAAASPMANPIAG